jgi:hypothetical protein
MSGSSPARGGRRTDRGDDRCVRSVPGVGTHPGPRGRTGGQGGLPRPTADVADSAPQHRQGRAHAVAPSCTVEVPGSVARAEMSLYSGRIGGYRAWRLIIYDHLQDLPSWGWGDAPGPDRTSGASCSSGALERRGTDQVAPGQCLATADGRPVAVRPDERASPVEVTAADPPRSPIRRSVRHG